MKLLLDTHILIWLLEGNQNLSPKVRQVIEDETNSMYLSIVSLWEIAIKTSLGKLQLELPLEKIICDFVLPSGIKVLPIDIAHLLTLQNLPFHHRDPFDRLLIAQAKSETLILVSEDHVFRQYQVNSDLAPFLNILNGNRFENNFKAMTSSNIGMNSDISEKF